MSQKISYYLLCPICQKGKNFKISYDAFDENGCCILNESMKTCIFVATEQFL